MEDEEVKESFESEFPVTSHLHDESTIQNRKMGREDRESSGSKSISPQSGNGLPHVNGVANPVSNSQDKSSELKSAEIRVGQGSFPKSSTTGKSMLLSHFEPPSPKDHGKEQVQQGKSSELKSAEIRKERGSFQKSSTIGKSMLLSHFEPPSPQDHGKEKVQQDGKDEALSDALESPLALAVMTKSLNISIPHQSKPPRRKKLSPRSPLDLGAKKPLRSPPPDIDEELSGYLRNGDPEIQELLCADSKDGKLTIGFQRRKSIDDVDLGPEVRSAEPVTLESINFLGAKGLSDIFTPPSNNEIQESRETPPFKSSEDHHADNELEEKIDKCSDLRQSDDTGRWQLSQRKDPNECSDLQQSDDTGRWQLSQRKDPIEVLYQTEPRQPEHIDAATRIMGKDAQSDQEAPSSSGSTVLPRPSITLPRFQIQRTKSYSKAVNTLGVEKEHWLYSEFTLFLILLGLLTALTNYFVDETISWSFKLRNFLFLQPESWHWQLVVYCMYYIVLTLLGIFITAKLTIAAVGSGIPHVRYLLSCEDIQKQSDDLLSLRVLIAKVLGVVCSVGAGMSVGREGPFVCISACLAHFMLKRVPLFRKYYDHSGLLRQAYAAACAVGISSCYNSPIGGVLLSIESTNTYYLLSNYWKGFLAAVGGFFLSQTINVLRFGREAGQSSYFHGSDANAENISYAQYEASFFIVLGVFMGLFGPLYLTYLAWVKKLVKFNRKSYSYRMGILVASISGVVFFVSGKFNRMSPFDSVNDLISSELLDPEIWGEEKLVSLFIFTVTRFIITPWAVSLSYPAGDFLPIFGFGAAIGRFFGIFVSRLWGLESISYAGYAICGGAALIGSTTHTLGAAVLVLEITGQFSFMLPVLMSVTIAVGISKSLGKSVYERGMEAQGLFFLPKLDKNVHFKLTAKDVMETDFHRLSENTNTQSILYLLQTSGYKAYPVVESKEKQVFLGCVSRRDLLQYIFSIFTEHELESEFFNMLKKEDTEIFEKVPSRSRHLHKWKDSFTTLTTLRNSVLSRRPSAFPASGSSTHLEQDPPIDAKKMKKLLITRINLSDNQYLAIDPAPSGTFRASEDMDLEQIYVLFELMRCKSVFVTTCRGILTGVVTRKILTKNLQTKQASGPAQALPTERMKQMSQGMVKKPIMVISFKDRSMRSPEKVNLEKMVQFNPIINSA